MDELKSYRLPLSHTLSLHFSSLFPYSNSYHRKSGYRIFIGIGGNIGNTIKIFEKLFLRLKRDRTIRLLSTSPILKNPPFGYLEQNDFYNGVILLETKLSPIQFLSKILYLEKRFGRKRDFPNGPRTLDIDILFFDHFKLSTSSLQVPHYDWQNRISIIIPLIFLL